MIKVQSYINNPVLLPNPKNEWESVASFNGNIIKDENGYHLIYRAVGKSGRSTIGIATGTDKHDFGHRRQLITPEFEWEKFGCEDPRVTKLGDTYYIFYTAISSQNPDANSIKVAVAISDDLKTIKEKHLVTPFNAKAMTLFPRRIEGKYVAVLTANTDRPPSKIAIAVFDSLEDMWSEGYWRKWYGNLESQSLPISRLTSDQVEVGANVVETEAGWLMVYSHIQKYFDRGESIFGIEAVLLDHQDPRKILGRTWEPLMIPQEQYELEGTVSNVIFPTGCLWEKERLYLYYGAADTSCAMASCDLSNLLAEMVKKNGHLIPRLVRYENNPIIEPKKYHAWESKSTFNPAAFYLGEKVYIIYRAMSEDNVSALGLAISEDGYKINEILEEPIYVPRYDFEKKKVDGAGSGCEDPRVTVVGSRLYMCYTAYNGIDHPRVAFTSILINDFLNRNWNWKPPMLISDPTSDNKDACLFPEKIGDKYVFIHREGGEGMVIDLVDDLEFENNELLEGQVCIPPRMGMWDSEKIGIASPPIRTSKGWLLLYHGMSENGHRYRLGTIMMDINDPSTIIGRSTFPILEPEEDYEKIGDVNNVVFPCGAVVIEDKLFVYYGGADKVVGVAVGKLDEIVDYTCFF